MIMFMTLILYIRLMGIKPRPTHGEQLEQTGKRNPAQVSRIL